MVETSEGSLPAAGSFSSTQVRSWEGGREGGREIVIAHPHCTTLKFPHHLKTVVGSLLPNILQTTIHSHNAFLLAVTKDLCMFPGVVHTLWGEHCVSSTAAQTNHRI